MYLISRSIVFNIFFINFSFIFQINFFFFLIIFLHFVFFELNKNIIESNCHLLSLLLIKNAENKENSIFFLKFNSNLFQFEQKLNPK